MNVKFGLASITLIAGICLLQACSSEDDRSSLEDDGTKQGSSGAVDSDSGTKPAPSPGADAGQGAEDDAGGAQDAGGASGEGGVDAGAKSKMTFFVTSTGNGAEGGNFGGLKGADDKCKALAAAAGGGDHTWAAYLSAEAAAGGNPIHAKDRIGAGPWTNQKGVVVAKDLSELHAKGIKSANIVDEKGAAVPAKEHDIFTGSKEDGTLFAATDASCNRYTAKQGSGARVGHSDWDMNDAQNPNDKWNSAHALANCDQATIAKANGSARFYCFAKD